jgi:hypothetical protein
MSQDDSSYSSCKKKQLDEHVEKSYSHIKKFRETHPNLWILADGSILFSDMIVACLIRQKLSISENFCLVFWESVNKYLRNSFLQIIQGDLVVGIALLRMSIELTRDINCISGDKKLLDILLHKDTEGNKYLDNFKFNTKSLMGERLFSFYRFCSQCRIEAHRTEIMESIKMEDNPHPDIAGLEETYFPVLNFVHFWFNACNTITSHLIESFSYRKEAEVIQIFRDFCEFSVILNKALKALTKMDSETAQMWFGELDLPTIH